MYKTTLVDLIRRYRGTLWTYWPSYATSTSDLKALYSSRIRKEIPKMDFVFSPSIKVSNHALETVRRTLGSASWLKWRKPRFSALEKPSMRGYGSFIACMVGGGNSKSPTQSARRVKLGSCSNAPEKRAWVANETRDMPPVPISAESRAETPAVLVISSPPVAKQSTAEKKG